MTEDAMTEQVWTPNPDGEYNEQATVVNQTTVTIYSDRDGETWMARYGEKTSEDIVSLNAMDVVQAREEALNR
jgi:hypothetical protein